MSAKRKRTSQSRQAAVLDSLPAPKTPKTPTPPPWTLPFPRLPTIDDSSTTDADDTDLQSISESGVLATALLQSRELWIQGYHFQKVWKPTRRGRKDHPQNSQYVTTRIGICPVVIGPHIFPEARFLWVRKVDEEAEKAEKAAKAAEKAKKSTKVVAPKPTPSAAPAATMTPANAVTVKALTDIAEKSPEFSAILQAVANRTATPEQHAALTQYMRAASLIPPARPPAPPQTPSLPAAKLVTPITTIPKTPIATIPASSGKPGMQAAPIPPVPKITPGPASLMTVLPRTVSTPVTRIPPPTGSITPVLPVANVNTAPVTTPITRIPPPSSQSPPLPTTPASSSSPAVNPTVAQPATPSTAMPNVITPVISTTTPTPTPSQPSPHATPDTSTPPLIDPMSFVEIAFELAEPGERLLIPRHTILEKYPSRQGGINVLASFIITIRDNSLWLPITLKLNNCPLKIYESLAKYVFAPGAVAEEMERVMTSCARFQERQLRLRVPVGEEGFRWEGLDRKVEKKKYVRKKKEKEKEIVKVEEEEDGGVEPVGKKSKSLVVGLKYTPTKKEVVEGEIEVMMGPSVPTAL